MKTYKGLSFLAVFLLLVGFMSAKNPTTTTTTTTTTITAQSEAEKIAGIIVSTFNKYIVLADSQTTAIKQYVSEYYQSREEANLIANKKERIVALAEIDKKLKTACNSVLTEEQIHTFEQKQKEEVDQQINKINK